MMKDTILALLWENPGRDFSGAELARRLNVSRSAVWKAVEQLRAEGYAIASAPRRGYRMAAGGDVLSAAGIARYLRHKELEVRFYPTISSTNTVLKALAAEGAPAGLALVAAEQSAGRGRMGRRFYSPAASGVYLSLLLRPELPAEKAVKLTACAAVAAAETIEALSGGEAQIKWVNDIFVGGKKVCGILTEASLDCESGRMHHVVVGIGVNTRVPEGDFPEELRGIAGAAFGEREIPDLRCRLAAGILDRLADYAEDPDDPAILAAYRRRSLVPGKRIDILTPGAEPVAAEAVAVEEDYSLLVRLADGSLRRLSSGEVSVKL